MRNIKDYLNQNFGYSNQWCAVKIFQNILICRSHIESWSSPGGSHRKSFSSRESPIRSSNRQRWRSENTRWGMWCCWMELSIYSYILSPHVVNCWRRPWMGPYGVPPLGNPNPLTISWITNSGKDTTVTLFSGIWIRVLTLDFGGFGKTLKLRSRSGDLNQIDRSIVNLIHRLKRRKDLQIISWRKPNPRCRKLKNLCRRSTLQVFGVA